MCPPCKRLTVSPGFCLLAAWFALANGWRTLGLILTAALLHEGGHALALRLLGAEISAFRIGILGGELTADRRRLSYAGELAAVLAGPAANLLVALASARGGGDWAVFTGANLVLCAFNLLPLRPLDGGQALYLAVSWRLGPEAGERTARAAGLLTAGGLTAGLVSLMLGTGGSLWLLPMSAAAAGAFFRELSRGALPRRRGRA